MANPNRESAAPIRILTKRPQRRTTAPALLTAREIEILLHLHEGETDRLIAQKLGLCEKTVQHHVQTVCRKLSAANRSQAIIFALRQKIIPLA